MAQFIRALAQGLCLDLVLFDKLRVESVIDLVIPIKFVKNRGNILGLNLEFLGLHNSGDTLL